MKKSELTKRIGQRILSEANDLKRTLETVSQDISIASIHLIPLLTVN